MEDPAPILGIIDGFRHSKTLFAAVELGIFDGARPRGQAVEQLLDACVSLGLLERRGTGYLNTPLADQFLSSGSPTSLAGYVGYANAKLYPMWTYLEDAIIEGLPRWEQTFGRTGAKGGGPRRLFRRFRTRGPGYLRPCFRDPGNTTRDFMDGMHGFGMISSPRVAEAFDLSRFHRFVDLGGSTGHLALALLKRYPGMETSVFELPKVIPVIREYTGDRVRLIPGDFFNDPLPPADLYGLGKVLHNHDPESCRRLLAKIHAALPEGGGLLVVERFLHEDRSGPLAVHMASLNMLVVTSGRERTCSEYLAMLQEAGFTKLQAKITGAPVDVILAIK